VSEPHLLQKAPNRIHHITREEFEKSQDTRLNRVGVTACRAWSAKKNLTDNWRFVNCPACLKYCPAKFRGYHSK
jgi:Pyruvate/2-oxoacid:ferredoxin oxidoreductase delta subunit